MPRTYEIRDPLHGLITLDEWEWDLINQPAFQRLRRIKQLAWTDYVYPGATHTRFEHSLGVMHTATRMFDGICTRNRELLSSEFSINEDGIGRQTKVIRLAALLHDLGHAPFSHGAEEVFPIDPVTGRHFEHEQYSAAILEFGLKDVLENHPLNRNNYRITVDDLKEVFSEKPRAEKNLLWKHLVSGQMDADRMDYLLRDSLHAGVSYGRYDLDRIIATSTLCQEPETQNWVVGVDEGGSHAVEGLLIARYMMFTQVYFHKTRTIYDYHLIEALREILKPIGGAFPPPTSAETVRDYLQWDDWKTLGEVRSGRAGPHGEILLDRKHYRLVHSTSEVPTQEELEKFGRASELLRDLGSVEREAGKSWYKFASEGIWVRSDRSGAGSTVRELSTLSPVVKGLLPVRQNRIYVPMKARATAQERLRTLN